MEKISVASDKEGLSTIESVDEVRLPLNLKAARRVVFMIHGYQTPEHKATASFARFRRLIGVAATYRHPTVIGELCGFYWPGHHPKFIPSLLTFSARISDAKQSGLLLADVIRGMSADQEVVLVAHSLGCRVALHALRQIRSWGPTYTGPKLTHVFLMAAAVPSSMCNPDSGIYGVKPTPELEEHVFHSAKDLALKPLAFGLGTYAYEEAWSSAVGVAGEPAERWEPHTHATTLQHGQYWSSLNAANTLVDRLGFAASTRLAVRSLAEWPAAKTVRISETRTPRVRGAKERRR